MGANLKTKELAVLDYYAHVLNDYNNEELLETLEVDTSQHKALLGNSEKLKRMNYKEAQIHGEIEWDKHVERLVVHEKHKESGDEERLRTICEKHGWGFSWMDEERERMEKESMHKLGGESWKSQLAALQETGGTMEVPEGFCRN